MTNRAFITLHLCLCIMMIQSFMTRNATAQFACTAQELNANGGKSCPPPDKPSGSKTPKNAASPFLDITKPTALNQHPTNESDFTVSSTGLIGGTTETTMTSCVIDGYSENLDGSNSIRNQNVCLTGWTQILMPGEYDIRGISNGLALDQIKRNLHCYFSGYEGNIRKADEGKTVSYVMECVGVVDQSPLEYRSKVLLSLKYKKFITSDPELWVCGPSMIVKGSDVYNNLLKKFGTPIKTEAKYNFGGGGEDSNQIQEIWFKTRHSTLITSAEAKSDDLIGKNLKCNSYLRFRLLADGTTATFLKSMGILDQNGQAQVQSKF